MALPTIVRAIRATVRDALGRAGVSASFGATRFDQVLANVGGLGTPVVLAIRNVSRRRGRLVLALAMLAAGGGLFITALNTREGWRALAERIKTDRAYHADFRLIEPVPIDRIETALASVDAIQSFETWGYRQTAFAQEGRIDVMRTYPDRGHGRFALYGVPPQTSMIRFPVTQGRWLRTARLVVREALAYERQRLPSQASQVDTCKEQSHDTEHHDGLVAVAATAGLLYAAHSMDLIGLMFSIHSPPGSSMH